MTSLTRFIEGRLKLQVNAQKSAVARPWQRSFLGFTVTDEPQPRLRSSIRNYQEQQATVAVEPYSPISQSYRDYLKGRPSGPKAGAPR